MGAYGKRYGASFADNSVSTYMTTAIFPSLLREDPRYYQLGKGRFAHRAYHAINRLFVIRTDFRRRTIQLFRIPRQCRGSGNFKYLSCAVRKDGFTKCDDFCFLILYDGMNNELKEFWPDIRRKVFHEVAPKQCGCAPVRVGDLATVSCAYWARCFGTEIPCGGYLAEFLQFVVHPVVQNQKSKSRRHFVKPSF